MSSEEEKSEFEPQIMAFCCEFCAYNAADLAGSMRLDYSPNIRIIKVPCSGRVNPTHILKAFEKGADGVYVAGCEEGDCHFVEGNYRSRKRVAHTKKLIEEVGLEPERLEFFHVGASNAPMFKTVADEMTQRIRKLGPSPLRKK